MNRDTSRFPFSSWNKKGVEYIYVSRWIRGMDFRYRESISTDVWLDFGLVLTLSFYSHEKRFSFPSIDSLSASLNGSFYKWIDRIHETEYTERNWSRFLFILQIIQTLSVTSDMVVFSVCRKVFRAGFQWFSCLSLVINTRMRSRLKLEASLWWWISSNWTNKPWSTLWMKYSTIPGTFLHLVYSSMSFDCV